MMDEPSVTLYTQPLCRSCDRVKSKLEEAGIEFDVYDITVSDAAYSFVKNTIGAKSVPVIVGPYGEAIVGYQPDKLKELIDELRV